MNDRMKMFCKEYLIDMKPRQAALRSGYAEGSATRVAKQLMAREDIQELIAKEMEARSVRTGITADEVLKEWHNIATADPNEIICYRRVNCRYCYGDNHKYQWRSEEEYNKAVKDEEELAREEGRAPYMIDNSGGFGFEPLLTPHAKCPRCNGEGLGQVHVNDTRFLSEKARALFAGIKIGANGSIEIKLRDKDRALENLARHLGLMKENLDISVVKKLEDYL